jgi:transcription antitermination factor NusB
MALQMLYQSDLGGSSLPQIFNTFDVSDYPARDLGRKDHDGTPQEPAPGEARGKRPRPKTRRDRSFERRRRRLEEAFGYARNLVEGTLEHREEIDELIRDQADNWRLERMPAVDRNILRLAIFEMLYEQDVPKLVVVDEAIELAKRFGSEQSGRFVNGLLDGLLKQHDFPGKLK